MRRKTPAHSLCLFGHSLACSCGGSRLHPILWPAVQQYGLFCVSWQYLHHWTARRWNMERLHELRYIVRCSESVSYGGATCGDTSCGGTPDIYVYFVPQSPQTCFVASTGRIFEMEYEYDGALSGSNSGSQVTLEYGWQQCDSSDFNCTNYNTPWVIWSTTRTLSESGPTTWDLYVSSPVSGDYYGFGGGAQPALYMISGLDGTGGATVDFYNSPYYMTATDFEADT